MSLDYSLLTNKQLRHDQTQSCVTKNCRCNRSMDRFRFKFYDLNNLRENKGRIIVNER